jgi:sec-independent protein translocase protein TatA
MLMLMTRVVALLSAFGVLATQAFAPISTTRSYRSISKAPTSAWVNVYAPPSLQRQRQSVASIQTQGLFGLGAPEVAIILVVAAFILGPEKLASLGRDAGKIAGELKDVPKEFQKGLEEGETNARSVKAKVMEDPPREIADAKKE